MTGSPRRHLILVGLMGAGKTAVGEACARRLERAFVDTDAVIVAAAGVSIAEIFAAEGEDGFRQRERRAVTDACSAAEPAVIACGGGVVVDPDNRRDLRRAGVVVWLTAAAEVLVQRVGAGDGRPLLAVGEPLDALTRLAEEREPHYRRAADTVIDTTGLGIDEVADAAVRALAAEGVARR